jgi:hypothetical protein
MRSKWLDWKPNSVGFVGSPSEGNPIIRPLRARIIENSPEDEATKPTKPPLQGEMPSSNDPTKPTKPLRIRVVESAAGTGELGLRAYPPARCRSAARFSFWESIGDSERKRFSLGSSSNAWEATRMRDSAGEDGHQLPFCEVT